MLPRERDQRDLHEVLPRQVVDGETHAVHRNRAAWNRDLPHRGGHPQIVHPGVPTPLEPRNHRDAVHVSLDDVATQAIRRAQRALQIHGAPGRVLAEQGAALRRLHHVHRESTLHRPLDREACPVDGDALTRLEALGRSPDRECEPGRRPFSVFRRPYDAVDPTHRAHDSGKHSRLSNTNNVSGPRARRSTGVQRGAAARGCGGTPGKAGTAPSPSHTGACTQYSRSTRPSARSRAPSAPPPSHSTDWIAASRSMRSPSRNVVGRNTRTPLRSSWVTLDGGASSDDMTHVGTSRAVLTSCTPRLSIARRSNTTRTGGRRGVTGPRTVSWGLSRRAVVPPTAIASNPARNQCTCSRAASPETHCELPAASAMRPSIDVASLSATKGRSACSRANRNGACGAAAAPRDRPSGTVTPCARSAAAPPRASGSGSRMAATTRVTPAAMIASVQGGVFPWCAQGSRFTTRVAPRARSPAARKATTSACGPPNSAWYPAATTASPASTTAPTSGFGATRPLPRRARSRARSIAICSAGRGCARLLYSESEPDADASEDMRRLRIEVREPGEVGLILACLQANLAYQVHGREGEATIHECHGAGIGRIDHHGPRVRRVEGVVVEPDVRVLGLVVVHADSRRDVQQRELPPRHGAIAVRLEIHGELELVPLTERGTERAVPEPRHGAMHPAHRERGHREGAPEQADAKAIADPQRRVARRVTGRRRVRAQGNVALGLLRCEGNRTQQHCQYHRHSMHATSYSLHATSYRSANVTPVVPTRTSPMIHVPVPARVAAVMTASVSSRAATAIMPTPRLNTRRISRSETSPA